LYGALFCVLGPASASSNREWPWKIWSSRNCFCRISLWS